MTVRIDDALRDALERRAQATGTSVSDVVRKTLREALDERPLAERIGHLKGTVTIRGREEAWRRARTS